MKKYFFLIHIPALLLILAIFILPLLRPCLIVGGDWTFPETNKQLLSFATDGMSLWSNREIPTGGQISHQNLYLLNFLALLWANLGFAGTSFQKTTLILTLVGIYFSAYYLFLNLTKNRFASLVGALSYLFSPVVFNYLNMGWNYVLLFLALAPLFALISTDYFSKGGLWRVVALSYISAIGFFQSQSLVWFPIILTIVYLTNLSLSNSKKHTIKFLSCILVIFIITFAIHLPWILPILLKLDYSITSTSSSDVLRFS